LKLTIRPTPRTEDGETAGTLDFIPDYGGLPVTIRDVTPNSPASEAGLQTGDRISAINGENVRSAEQVTQYIRDHRGQPINLTIERHGQSIPVTTQSRRLPDGRDRLGIETGEEIPFERAGIGLAAGYAVRTNIEILRLTGKALGQLFTGQRSVRNTLSGPVGIYKAASTSVQRFGWGGLFQTLAFLSLNLGIFNLLPIPVLDGGAIFLLLVEGLLATVGLSISTSVRERIQQVGFVMVILLMVFVITNDVLKTFTRSSSDEKPPPASAPAK
jgi:regulator of sigma E protease